jgi:hypothetical protein
MTVKGQHQLTEAEHKRMARLMQLHMETHPGRLGRLYGVTAGHIRQQWRRFTVNEMAPLVEALDDFVPERDNTS